MSDKETEAIYVCFEILNPLSPEARERALKYLHDRLVKDEIDRAVAIVMMLHPIGKLKTVLDVSPNWQEEESRNCLE